MEPMRARKALRISQVGLRGVVGAGLTASHVIDFASAFGTFVEPGRPVLLGRDPRASGCMIREGSRRRPARLRTPGGRSRCRLVAGHPARDPALRCGRWDLDQREPQHRRMERVEVLRHQGAPICRPRNRTNCWISTICASSGSWTGSGVGQLRLRFERDRSVPG